MYGHDVYRAEDCRCILRDAFVVTPCFYHARFHYSVVPLITPAGWLICVPRRDEYTILVENGYAVFLVSGEEFFTWSVNLAYRVLAKGEPLTDRDRAFVYPLYEADREYLRNNGFFAA